MHANDVLAAFGLIMEEPQLPPSVALSAVTEGAGLRPIPTLPGGLEELLRLAALGYRTEQL